MNHLSDQSSPYLIQHVNNPVDWYPYTEEAFDKALEEEKLIFISIGYSACHWCHVMQHESFEDEDTAKILNEHFVSIKVDREERPDIDQLYQTMVQAMGKNGGWPLSIFLTPKGKPIFFGSYFPKKPRFGMISFTDLLHRLISKFKSAQNEMNNAGEQILSQLEKINTQQIININTKKESPFPYPEKFVP